MHGTAHHPFTCHNVELILYFIQDRRMYAPLVQLKLWLVIHLLCIAHFPATQLSLFDGRNQARNLYQVKLIDIYVFMSILS